jgi:flagellar hook protein FlgE
MMRSMYSAVSGLKTHQTKMDVIGNNISNVNTVAFKSSSVTFQDMLYQNTSGASGANATTGVGGVNAKQIGLGVTTGATNISITSAGAAETTGNPFDIRLTDSSTTNFFIVNNGSENLFTRSGSFYVDGSGNLCMTSTGYTVMGWQVDPNTDEIKKDTVSALRIMKTENLTSPAEATTDATCGGIIDKNDPDVTSDEGMVKNLNFYDKQGYAYTARFRIKSTGVDGEFSVELESILDSESKTIFPTDTTTDEEMAKVFGIKNDAATLATYDEVKKGFYLDSTTGKIYAGSSADASRELTFNGTEFTDANGNTYSLKQVYGISDGMVEEITGGATAAVDANGVLTITGTSVSYTLKFSTADGSFDNINGMSAVTLNLQSSGLFANGGLNFEDISIDFSTTKNANNGGKSTATMDSGNVDDEAIGKGKKLGALIGLSVNNNGEIYGTYDNGNTELLGQIAVAQFANASGLEKVGDNCYATTLNSGEFDGIGVEISADGSKMTSGELEMSNVDLSTEFTQMITTQRGFQANSRVITTSDTLLEELVNLKR